VNKIKAYRDGQEREFTQKVWAAMGIGHCGWTAVPDVPKEVASGLATIDQFTLVGKTYDPPLEYVVTPRKTRQKK